MFKNFLRIKLLQPLILIVLGILLILLSRSAIGSALRVPFSYLFEPVSFTAQNFSNSLSNWGTALFDASAYIEENEKLREEILEIKSKETSVINHEEYSSLKANEALMVTGGEYVLSKVLSFSQKGDIYINTGIKEGVKVGDSVLLGNVFVGIISSVDSSGALVRLPTNRSSSYEVVILPSTVNAQESIKLDGYIKSTAVVTGVLEGIKIENIGINSEVLDGDTVVLRDERIGQLLIIGRVVGLSNNPASTSKSGFVSPIFDYSNLLTVFVKIK
ncbi:MAG: rod shape-determining protein MreC [Candidatus Dojkabacteria bacterium]|jgi:cell shape-determining protein MreC